MSAAAEPLIKITDNVGWAEDFWNTLTPLKNKIVNHVYFKEMAAGTLSLQRFQRGLRDFYPLVESFPKHMAINLAKTKPGVVPGHSEAKLWLMQNIQVEQTHAQWWTAWARGFRCTQEQLEMSHPSPAMNAINHFLWHTNLTGSLVEGIAATNLAIEWPTGEWTESVLSGVRTYARQQMDVGEKSLAWLKGHALYDDNHPYEAMELIKLCAHNDTDREAALNAATRSMEYYLMALDACYHADLRASLR